MPRYMTETRKEFLQTRREVRAQLEAEGRTRMPAGIWIANGDGTFRSKTAIFEKDGSVNIPSSARRTEARAINVMGRHRIEGKKDDHEDLAAIARAECAYINLPA